MSIDGESAMSGERGLHKANMEEMENKTDWYPKRVTSNIPVQKAWITDDIFLLTEARRLNKRNMAEYFLNTQMDPTRICAVKEARLKQKCIEMEELQETTQSAAIFLWANLFMCSHQGQSKQCFFIIFSTRKYEHFWNITSWKRWKYSF